MDFTKIRLIACDGGVDTRLGIGVGCAIYNYNGEAKALHAAEVANCTNQRAELNGLICGLTHAITLLQVSDDETPIWFLFDSAYVKQGFEGRWWNNWESNGWITSEGYPVKNQDLWKLVAHNFTVLEGLVDMKLDMELDDLVTLVQIRSHINPSPRALKNQEKAQASFIKNNGFNISIPDLLKLAEYNNAVDAECTLIKEKLVQIQ